MMTSSPNWLYFWFTSLLLLVTSTRTLEITRTDYYQLQDSSTRQIFIGSCKITLAAIKTYHIETAAADSSDQQLLESFNKTVDKLKRFERSSESFEALSELKNSMKSLLLLQESFISNSTALDELVNLTWAIQRLQSDIIEYGTQVEDSWKIYNNLKTTLITFIGQVLQRIKDDETATPQRNWKSTEAEQNTLKEEVAIKLEALVAAIQSDVTDLRNLTKALAVDITEASSKEVLRFYYYCKVLLLAVQRYRDAVEEIPSIVKLGLISLISEAKLSIEKFSGEPTGEKLKQVEAYLEQLYMTPKFLDPVIRLMMRVYSLGGQVDLLEGYEDWISLVDKVLGRYADEEQKWTSRENERIEMEAFVLKWEKEVMEKKRKEEEEDTSPNVVKDGEKIQSEVEAENEVDKDKDNFYDAKEDHTTTESQAEVTNATLFNVETTPFQEPYTDPLTKLETTAEAKVTSHASSTLPDTAGSTLMMIQKYESSVANISEVLPQNVTTNATTFDKRIWYIGAFALTGTALLLAIAGIKAAQDSAQFTTFSDQMMSNFTTTDSSGLALATIVPIALGGVLLVCALIAIGFFIGQGGRRRLRKRKALHGGKGVATPTNRHHLPSPRTAQRSKYKPKNYLQSSIQAKKEDIPTGTLPSTTLSSLVVSKSKRMAHPSPTISTAQRRKTTVVQQPSSMVTSSVQESTMNKTTIRAVSSFGSSF